MTCHSTMTQMQIRVDACHVKVVGVTAQMQHRSLIRAMTSPSEDTAALYRAVNCATLSTEELLPYVVDAFDFSVPDAPRTLEDVYRQTQTGFGCLRDRGSNVIEFHPYIKIRGQERWIRTDAHALLVF